MTIAQQVARVTANLEKNDNPQPQSLPKWQNLPWPAVAFPKPLIKSKLKDRKRDCLVQNWRQSSKQAVPGKLVAKHCSERRALRVRARSRPLRIIRPSQPGSSIRWSTLSAFDGMLGSMVPVALRTGTVGAVNVGATAYSVAEGSTKIISKLSIVGQQQNPTKAHCFVVLTQETARAVGAQAVAFIGRELRNAVAVTTDTQFLGILVSGLSVATSAGPTAEAVRADISTLLKAITTGQTSKLFLITTPLIVKCGAC